MNFTGHKLPWTFDALEAVRRWPSDRRLCVLHSGRFDARWARWSVLAQPVGTYRFVTHSNHKTTQPAQGQSQWLGPPEACPASSFTHKPFSDLRKIIHATDGLWIGYLSYDLAHWIERLPHGCGDGGWPIIELGYCPGYLVYDGLTQSWSACGTWSDATPSSEHSSLYPDLSHTDQRTPHGFTTDTPHNTMSQAGYEAAVTKAKDYIAAGDVFQANIAQRFTADISGDTPHSARGLFDQLARVSPAWYGAYLELAPTPRPHSSFADTTVSLPPLQRPDKAIASTSPELFLRVDGRHVVTRPIKGTRPSSVDPIHLRDSEKDLAELNMIVDLMRNDLGRVCGYGSIRVTNPRVIESHPTVHHGVATIEGKLHESKDIVDLLRATLPSGSVTGTPKVRAMQIISELEPASRGPYCGCIGYISRNSACLSVAIRTMLIDLASRRVDFCVGAGIVADSQPKDEFQETLDKAAPLMAVLGQRHEIENSESGHRIAITTDDR